MKLSGWVRLWIVASVFWWGAGAVWLVTNFSPETVPFGYVEPTCQERAALEAPAGLLPPPACSWSGPPEVEDWTWWQIQLAVVVAVPLALALIVGVVKTVSMWVWRGFFPKKA